MPPWHSAQCPPHTPNPDPQRLAVLYDRAQTLHGAETKKFHAASGNSEASFLAKMASGGTLSDRLSALTLLIQSSPIHNTAALETLRSIAQRGKGKGGREDALKALRCIVDWWVGGGAPRSRKLRYFRDAVCLDTAKTEDSHLVLWYFEDWLKKYFFSILQVLETLSLDTLPYIRTQSLTLITNLLKDTPEQEQNLLRLLVNKLGDVEKSICSRASHHILQLLQTHPAMKSVVVKEMVALVMKPSASSSSTAATVSGNGQNSKITFSDAATSTSPSKSKSKPPQAQLSTSQIHARYYAVVTFNQIVLSSSPTDRQVALKLLDVYFDLFRQVLGLRESQPSSSSQKHDDAPSDDDDEKDPEAQQQPKLDSQGRVIDYATHPKKKAKRRSQLDRTTKKGAAGFAEIQDSDSKLVGAILTGVNRAVPFVGLDLGLQGGDGADGAKEGIRKHIDTLFLISHKSTFNISIQALVLLQQISAALMEASSSSGGGVAKSIVDRYYRTLYASLLDPRLGTSNKQAMYLNLFFKSVKASVAEGSGLSREQKVERKERKKDRRRKEKSKAKESDDEEERDQPRIAEDETRRQSLDRTLALVRRFIQVLVSAGPAAGVSGGVEFVSGGLFLLGELFSSIPGLRTLILHPPLQQETSSTSQLQPYDPHKRDPLYTHASSPLSPLWLLNTLTMHYHPATSLHASQILQGKQVTASADLELGSLGHFLERFVYKNAKGGKKAAEKGQGEDGWDEDGEEGRGREEKKLGKGGSAMQPSAAALEGVKKGGVGGNGEGGGGVDPSDRAFWGRSEASLPVDQIFFARYFKRKEEGEKKRGKKGKKDEEDESEGEGEGSEDDDESKKPSKQVDDFSDAASDDGSLDEEEVMKAIKASMPGGGLSDLDDDDSDAGFDLGGDEDDDEIPEGLSGPESDEDEDEDEDQGDGESDGDISLIGFDDSDDEDGYNTPVPSEGDAGEDVAMEGEEWGGIQTGSKRKSGRDEDDERKKKKRGALPTFASYEDYAHLLDRDDDEDGL